MDLTFGARLRSQRERLQISLTAIAEETKINLALLDGLERDDLSRWPGGLFRRAYVRDYAQRIGLDPERVLREFLDAYPDPIEETSQVEAIVQGAEKRPRTRLGFLIAGLAKFRAQRDTENAAVPRPPKATVERTDPLNQATPQDFATTAPIAVEPPAEAPRAVKLMKVPPAEPQYEMRRDPRNVERQVASMARLCTRAACARDIRAITAALDEAVGVLEAQGAIVWVWDADATVLWPVLASGYPDEMLSRLPGVARSADNAIAAAFRSGQKRVVRGSGNATGAVVAPLLSPDGCVGALALEFTSGGEQQEIVQALAAIFSAQISTLFAAVPQSSITDEEEWPQTNQNLAAS